MLPSCHTSPLGPQACEPRPDIPPQRQTVVPFAVQKVLQSRDLSRCNLPAASVPALLSPIDIPLSATLRNATCLTIVAAGKRAREEARFALRTSGGASPCAQELEDDTELRMQLPLGFAQHAFLDAMDLLSDSLPTRLPPGDVYLSGAFNLFAHAVLGKPFGLCQLPRETEGVLRMSRYLERSFDIVRNQTLCVHWRGEDFHHPTTLSRHRGNASAIDVASRWVAPTARKSGATSVLLLTNARHESMVELLTALRAGGLTANSPRTLTASAFGCHTSYTFTVFAEMVACSRAAAFLGTPRSSFSQHIVAMRSARGMATGAEFWMGKVGSCENQHLCGAGKLSSSAQAAAVKTKQLTKPRSDAKALTSALTSKPTMPTNRAGAAGLGGLWSPVKHGRLSA